MTLRQAGLVMVVLFLVIITALYFTPTNNTTAQLILPDTVKTSISRPEQLALITSSQGYLIRIIDNQTNKIIYVYNGNLFVIDGQRTK